MYLPKEWIPELWITLSIVALIIVIVIIIVRKPSKDKSHPWEKLLKQEEFTLHDYQRYYWGHTLQMLSHDYTTDNGWHVYTSLGFGYGISVGDVLLLKSGALLICEIKYMSNPKDMFEITAISVDKDVVMKKGKPYRGSGFIL